MSTSSDALVHDYLGRLERAAAHLPPDRRAELLEGIAEHIDAARASGAAPDEPSLRTVLDRLGPPEEIVAAAREDLGPSWGGPAPGWASTRPRGTGVELAAVLMLTVGSFVPVAGWLVGVALLWSSSLWRLREKLLGTLVVPLGPGGVLLLGALLPFRGSTVCSSTGGVVGGAGVPGLPVPGAPPPPDLPPDAPPPPDLPPDTGGDVYEQTVCTTEGLVGVPGWAGVAAVVLLLVLPLVVAVVLMRIARQRAAADPVPAVDAAGALWGPLEVAAVLVLALGGFLVPVIGSLVGLVLACVSPRWSVRDKLVATALSLTPALLMVTALALPAFAVTPTLPGGIEVVLLLLLSSPLAAIYLAVVLQRQARTPS